MMMMMMITINVLVRIPVTGNRAQLDKSGGATE
jgi:hypothetical protein